MLIHVAVVLFIVSSAYGFTSSTTSRKSSTILMIAPKPSGFATTKEGKLKAIERTKALVDKSSMIITIPFGGVSKENTDILRKSLPEGTVASMVKNALLKQAVKGTSFEVIAENLRDQNLFFFIPEGKAKPSYEALKKWQKEIKRMEPNQQAKSVVLENNFYTGAELESVVNLPTKIELITKIAIGIKAPSLKLAKAVKAVPNKFGRAFGALKKKLEDEANPAPVVDEAAATAETV